MSTKNILFLTILISLSAFLSQCQAPVEQAPTETVQASFYVRYLADGFQLRGQATFFDADSSLIKIPGGVAFMGSGTNEKELPGQLIRYESTLQTPYQSELQFNFKLPDNEKSSKVAVKMSGLPGFKVTKASKSEGLYLDLDGELKTGETILLLFTDPNQEARTILRPGPLTQEQLFIPADALSHFIPGEYQLYLVKQLETEGQEATLDFNFSIEYYTTEEAFTLLE